jgi:DNA helicase II / ATP-dependent DNA helicase PcrA
MVLSLKVDCSMLHRKSYCMSEERRSLFVVGDDAQSIYGFRGSKIELILNFHREFAKSKEIVLNQNYRSTQPILNLSEKILEHNPHQKKKGLFTDQTVNTAVEYYMARSERDEAEFVVRKLAEVYLDQVEDSTHDIAESTEVKFVSDDDPISNMFDVYDGDFSSPMDRFSQFSLAPSVPKRDWSKVDKLNDCAILYRTHSQSRALEETFLKHGLPYRLVSGTKFLDRREIKDVVSILKYIANGEDTIAFSRFFPLISDGVGPKSLSLVLEYLSNPEFELKDKTKNLIDQFQKTVVDTIIEFPSIVEFAKQLLERIGYTSYLRKEYPIKEEYLARLENIGELYSLMLKYDQGAESITEKINLFLQEVSLMTNQDSGGEDVPKISLMSLHQSKGLEYETVFLVGIEDGLLPHLNSLYEAGGMEEEVRLAYVGVTRAKRHLYLISAESRVHFGQIQANPVSRIFRPFLNEFTKRVF